MQNQKAFIFCLIGGILLIIANAIASLGLYGDIIAHASALFPEASEILALILNVLLYIVGLGGVAVIIGAFLLSAGRVGLGKFIIGIAAGMSLIGLIITIIEIVIVSGAAGVINFLGAVSQAPGWIGAFLTILGRRMAKKPEESG
jgi:hypothetical protein